MAVPREPLPEDVRSPTERGQDQAVEDYVDDLARMPARPLTDDEEEAAEHDPGRPPRTYAPQSERTPKPPAPGDDRLIDADAEAAPSTAQAGTGADRSVPEEMR
jgi:hypothetical protein